MEALAYEESPLSDLLQSSHVGELPAKNKTTTSAAFAPSGLAKIRSRFEDIQRKATLIAKKDDHAFIEQFRYQIIASQLLESQSRPHRLQIQPTNVNPEKDEKSVAGAVYTAALSFAIVAPIRKLRTKSQDNTSWWKTTLTILVIVAACATIAVFFRRRHQSRKRQRTTRAVTEVLQKCQSFDNAFGAGLRHVQEVEVISRGYAIGSPLPPLTRLEEAASNLSNIEMRRVLSNTAKSVISDSVDIHNGFHPYTSEDDLAQYHGIYDVSLPEFLEAISWLNEVPGDTVPAMRDLRLLFETQCVARKVILCDLLALSAQKLLGESGQRLNIAQVLEELIITIRDAEQAIRSGLELEEDKSWPESEPEANGEMENADANEVARATLCTPGKEHIKAQKRRLDSLAGGIRSLNVKMHVFRGAAERATTQPVNGSSLGTILSSQHEQIGADLRSLLSEWEQGKRNMLLATSASNRLSLASSGLRSPASPSPSLGGQTMVDESNGPGDALRALTGDKALSSNHLYDLASSTTSDEEVFEAVSTPIMPLRKRHSLATSMTREQRVAKLSEDRRKRATLQEHQERTTSMLRELEMVIKHRPRGRTTSRANTMAV